MAYQFTAIVITYNEALHLRSCLSSLSFCDEILVYDMGSSDSSYEIARKLASKLQTIPRADIVEKVWFKVITDAKHDWIILNDPDEIFPKALFPYFSEQISENPRIGMFSVPWKFYFLGKPLNSTVWGGERYKSKVFHRERVNISPDVHNAIKLKPEFDLCQIPYRDDRAIKHYWVDSLFVLFEKHWRYIKNEGEARYQKGDRFSLRGMLVATFSALRKNLFTLNGIHDGWRGIFLSFFYAGYINLSHLSLLYYQKFVAKKNELDEQS